MKNPLKLSKARLSASEFEKQTKQLLKDYLKCDAEWARVDPEGYKEQRKALDDRARKLLK